MAKPIIFQLEFSGFQHARIDGDGDVRRPATADEIVAAIVTDFTFKVAEAHGCKLKVKVKRIA